MSWKIEIKDKPGIFDAIGQGVKKDIFDLGIKTVKEVSFVQIYWLEGKISQDDVHTICNQLLCDRISQEYVINPAADPSCLVVEVAHNPGVMDPVEDSTLKGIKDLGIDGVDAVRTAKKYLFTGDISPAQLKTISEKLLYNKLIQHIVKPQDKSGDDHSQTHIYQFKLVNVPLIKASSRQLLDISAKGQLFLNLTEMKLIRDYFRKLKREPTDCELETLAQTWSEHCGHKTFRGKIDYREKGKALSPKLKVKKINNLLKSTVMRATKELDKSWCVSVFQDNSGVIKFDEKNNVCFKVETHNHPSALEPFGGANTGVGGVIRDPLGTGLGAKPILNTDVFCFAPPDYPFDKLPPGTLHPKRIMKGVVSGVRDYGNKMGIPTVNGAVLFHDRFVGNPLVYCGTVGIMPKDKCFKNGKSGELIVVVGGRTGRDGIHGATFSSGELTHESETVSSGAVQIGNPIQEKKVVDAILQCRDLNLYNSITDCGAGGLSSAVGEMASELGCRVDLDKVPLKYQGLSYAEIWISESQERMVLSVPQEKIAKLQEICAVENVEAVVIGEFTDTKRLKLYYRQTLVCDLDMKFMHDGLPRTEKKAEYVQSEDKEPVLTCPKDLTPTLLKLLSRYDICSKEWIVRQYDHEVQGGSVIKPLSGIANDGPSDAAVVKPVLGSSKAVIVSNGINFRYGFIDPYWMAASSIDEALRQIIASGGSLKEVAILDNFCWGNPDKPDRLGSLVRSAYGCYDTAKGFGVPFISGKDSLYNEYAVNNKSQAIPGTLLISAIAVMEDAAKAVSMYAKDPGNLIYLVGDTFPELGGSHYYEFMGFTGNSVPRVNIKKAKLIFEGLSRCSDNGLIQSMHDCSDGGLAVAAAEMAFAGGLGMEISLSEVPYSGSGAGRNDFMLFSESNSRFVVEVKKADQKAFEKRMKGLAFGLIGFVSRDEYFKVFGLDNKICLQANISDLKDAWQKPLKW
ncbi:MAG: phosphoribosylformylglycinamidine synthase subunit PurL [Candidatus Omnitrophica bacterium]|jgi:phosphoribosylformylglycinamidine synthase|nr:phosphoribosylformylglycinamidine synthase subunit PurL [Candidatus Omnitrophota bacterium]MDD5079366.1 phosphoribosylformylglycinamidine synthase subunit PurL [Candidatus Omnitrophota bacterium]